MIDTGGTGKGLCADAVAYRLGAYTRGGGTPAWTGLIGATAIADSALEAETLSKMALLLGPAGAREVLAERGGIVIHDDGDVETIGPINGRIQRTRPLGAVA